MEKSIREILKDQAAWDVWLEMPADSKEKYQAYLCSREWALLRNKVMERCGGTCERCHANKADAVHHLHYTNKYHENLEDLRAFCRGCHEYTHGKSDIDPLAVELKRNPIRPLSSLIDDTHFQMDGYGVLRCPVCGFDYSHIRSAGTLVGSDQHEAAIYSGTQACGTTGSRRSALAITLDGECGHAWRIVIQQHKGNNYVSAEILQETINA